MPWTISSGPPDCAVPHCVTSLVKTLISREQKQYLILFIDAVHDVNDLETQQQEMLYLSIDLSLQPTLLCNFKQPPLPVSLDWYSG